MFDFSEMYRLEADLTRAGLFAADRAATVQVKTALDVVATAQQLVPVDTGATKNSIGWDRADEPDILAVEIGPTTEYAPHLEFGTSRMAPHAFMGPALDRHTPGYMAAMAEIAGGI